MLVLLQPLQEALLVSLALKEAFKKILEKLLVINVLLALIKIRQDKLLVRPASLDHLEDLLAK